MKQVRTSIFVFVSTVLLSVHASAIPVAPSPSLTTIPADAKSDPASVELNRGLQALSQNRLDQAETAFRKAAALDQKSPNPLLGLAQVAAQRNQLKQAETYLQKAEQLAPQVAEVFIAKARYYSWQEKPGVAENAFKKAVDLAPKAIPPRMELADFYLNQVKQPAKAVETYRGTLALNSRNGPAQYGLAMALSLANHRDQAIPEFERAATLLPRDPMPLQSLARLYISLGDTARALSTLDRVLTINSKFIPAHLDRGDIFLDRGDLKQALSEYQLAVQADPKNSASQMKLGTAYVLQKRWDEAETAFQQAISGNSKPADAYNNLAWLAAMRKKRLDDALTWAKQAVQLEPKSGGFHDTLGWVHYTRGELEPAAAALEQAVALDPREPAAFYHLGIVRAEQGRRELATTALRKALQVGPNFENAADAKRRLDGLSQK